jgi:tripartite-type tricarboxylate transporter receptor subunit TctC
MISRRRAIELLGSAALTPALSRHASAQTPSDQVAENWPNRVVRLVVPFVPGGSIDAFARIVAHRLSEIWGQQMVVENRGGGGSNIGHEAVVRSDPDGYTVLAASLPLAVNRFLFRTLNYDPVGDLAPVTLICTYPNVMTVPNSSPAKSVKEFVEFAKANKGKTTFASAGNGTSTHLAAELFRRTAGLEMTHVPYRGGGQAINDLIPGRVDVMFNTMGTALPLVKNGQLRGLAVTSSKRFRTAPDMPTVAESGIPGFDVSSWCAFLVPARTPQAIIRKIHADTARVLAEPAVIERMEQLGVEPESSTPAELAAYLMSEMDKWGPVIKQAGISVQD